MRSGIAATVLVAFTGTFVFASPGAGGRSSGHSGGGHPSGGHAVPRGSSGGHSGGGHYSGGHASGSRPSGGHSGGGYSSRGGQSSRGYAYSNRPSGGYGHTSRYSGAERRHPRAGYGTGSRYGYYGHGYNGHYPYRYNGYYRYGGYYPYYGAYSYPYYGAYGYPYDWGYGGLSVGLYYNNAYSAPASPVPYSTYGYPADDSYPREADAAPEAYAPREPRSDQGRPGTGAVRLVVRPDDASVYVDGEFRGVALRLGTLWLTPGRHRVEVVRPGFQVADRVVEVRLDAPVSLEVDLAHP